MMPKVISNEEREFTKQALHRVSNEVIYRYSLRQAIEDLTAFMRRLGFCEESGSGIDRALTHIELYQLPAPKIETYEEFTRITLFTSKPLKDMEEEIK